MLSEMPNLLITDDDAAFRDTLCSVFEPRGFRTMTAGDGAEALEIVQQDSVHLVLIDMHMPRLTGLETLKAFRELATPPPSILMSGALDDGIIAEAKLAQVFSVLAKPIRFAEVTSIVNEAMRATYDWPPR